MSIELVMPSHHLIPFSPCLRSFPASGSFPMSQLFTSDVQSIGVSASASVLPMTSGLISSRMDWLDLLAVQGTLKSLNQHHSSKASMICCSAFFMVQLSHPWLQSPYAVILEPKKIKSVTFSIVSPSLYHSDGTRCHGLRLLNVEFQASFFTLLFNFHQEAV